MSVFLKRLTSGRLAPLQWLATHQKSMDKANWNQSIMKINVAQNESARGRSGYCRKEEREVNMIKLYYMKFSRS